ncbi:hypothetical protein WA158_002571 [Blastocystis sp. Blastoise]
MATFYKGNYSFDQIFIVQRDRKQNTTGINYKNTICDSFSFPYCVFQTLDDSDHYAFMLSIFYQTNYVLYIDENEIDSSIEKQMTSSWLDSKIDDIKNNQIDLFSCIVTETTKNKNIKYFSGCLLIKQMWIRQLLTYTTINLKSSSVMNSLYSYMKEQKQYVKYTSFMNRANNINLLKDSSISSFICDDDTIKQNDTISVVSPLYKRNTVSNIYNGLLLQTIVPKYLVILQSLHYIEISNSIFINNTIPIYYIWSPNWNMKYHGRLYISCILDTKYIMSTDDDYFLNSKGIFSDIIPRMNKKNVILGKFGELNHVDAQLKRIRFFYSNDKLYDHVGNVFFFTPKMSKIYLRFKIYTLSYGEDIGFCLTNNIECKTESYTVDIPTYDTHHDAYRSIYNNNYTQSNIHSYHNIHTPNMTELFAIKSFDEVYNYYKSIGFIPINYHILKLSQTIINDGKYHF